MIEKTREQSVIININDLWKAVEELQRVVIKLHERLAIIEIEGGRIN